MLQQYNLSVQYEVIRNLLVEASFAGSRGVHWVQRVDLNQVPFSFALQGANTQANRPFPFPRQLRRARHRQRQQLVQLR